MSLLEFKTLLAPETLNAMNASRKADREHIARDLVTLADAYGATIRRRDEPKWRSTSAGIHLSFELDGVGAIVTINNLFGGVDALIHWHNTKRPVRNFTARFCGMVGARNTYGPHHKATSMPNGWYALAMCLDGGLMLARDGDAFEAAPETR